MFPGGWLVVFLVAGLGPHRCGVPPGGGDACLGRCKHSSNRRWRSSPNRGPAGGRPSHRGGRSGKGLGPSQDRGWGRGSPIGVGRGWQLSSEVGSSQGGGVLYSRAPTREPASRFFFLPGLRTPLSLIIDQLTKARWGRIPLALFAHPMAPFAIFAMLENRLPSPVGFSVFL